MQFRMRLAGHSAAAQRAAFTLFTLYVVLSFIGGTPVRPDVPQYHLHLDGVGIAAQHNHMTVTEFLPHSHPKEMIPLAALEFHAIVLPSVTAVVLSPTITVAYPVKSENARSLLLIPPHGPPRFDFVSI